ncbi:hypothetical protein VaNZ11_009450 [Volvox africanus]|uniref:DRBM domain-containing protein n=1 Tax=Volvox africanus TaxID=51714 RepID=A0ABQ5S7B8_9CHLO|nr:hypothetical protein VaNZ11_009450 [Volvox africanus]
MATVLLIRGVHSSPQFTREELIEAFSEHGTVLATAIVRQQTDGQCVGHAYVTVTSDGVAKAATVTEVAGEEVRVFPVDVDAWVLPPQEEDTTMAPAPASAIAMLGQGFAAGADALGLIPSTAYPNLNAVVDQLRVTLSSQTHTRLVFNNKPFYTLLNECCQKRQWQLEVSSPSVTDGAPFACLIMVMTTERVSTCIGRGYGPNKRDAKHNAAASCLDQLLSTEKLAASELISAMICPTAIAAAALPKEGGGGAGQQEGIGGAGVGARAPDPVSSAAILTHHVLRLGSYPGCAEVMRKVHGTEQGRAKTFLMVLNEYATKQNLVVTHEERTSTIGNFQYTSFLKDKSGDVKAKATGVRLGSKQEAKQSAAATLIEYIVTNLVTVDGFMRTGKGLTK